MIKAIDDGCLKNLMSSMALIELCDKICDQHIKDDDNSYKELEFDRQVNASKYFSDNILEGLRTGHTIGGHLPIGKTAFPS